MVDEGLKSVLGLAWRSAIAKFRGRPGRQRIAVCGRLLWSGIRLGRYETL